MPAYIDSMMYLGETPWHGHGVALTKPPSISEALIASGLDWEVEKKPTYMTNDEGLEAIGINSYTETGNYVTVRKDTNTILGHVSERYTILQNKDAFKPFDALLDFGYELVTAGAIEEGKKIWILAKAPEQFKVGDDAIQPYTFLFSSHDGSAGNSLRDTMVRIVCKNTLDLAISRKSTFSYSLKHTKNIKSNVDALIQRIKMSKGNVKLAVEDMNRMHEYKMNPHMLTSYLEDAIPFLKDRHRESMPELGIIVRNTAKPIYEKMVDNFYNGAGNKGETLWDAYNAITQYYTHDKNYKDWVKSTQFGKAYDHKVSAYYIAKSYIESNSINSRGGWVN